MKVLEQSLLEDIHLVIWLSRFFHSFCCTTVIGVIFWVAKIPHPDNPKENKTEIYSVPDVRIFIPKTIP
jgi:hypothetical protein